VSDPDVAVSIIVSTRNRAHFLPDCLGSLVAQECAVPIEIVVIDNGSTDATTELLERWTASDPRVRTAREDRVGLSRGKNAGITLARGDLLLFTDDDVVADPAWAQSYVELFSRLDDDLAIAGGSIVPVPKDLGAWPRWFSPGALADVGLWTYPEERALGPREYVFGSNMAVPSRLFAQFGTWDESLGNVDQERGTYEDTEFQDRVRRSDVSVWFCPYAVVKHRVPAPRMQPRTIISNAFGRGRSEFWSEALLRHGDEARVPPRGLLTGTVSLGADLARQPVLTAAFRISPSPRTFDLARRAAWRTGRRLESLRPGRASDRTFRAIERVTLLAQRVLLRLLTAGFKALLRPQRTRSEGQ
jgi:GT2 family glycosyltransferase